jgi:hypothetical protein
MIFLAGIKQPKGILICTKNYKYQMSNNKRAAVNDSGSFYFLLEVLTYRPGFATF